VAFAPRLLPSSPTHDDFPNSFFFFLLCSFFFGWGGGPSSTTELHYGHRLGVSHNHLFFRVWYSHSGAQSGNEATTRGVTHSLTHSLTHTPPLQRYSRDLRFGSHSFSRDESNGHSLHRPIFPGAAAVESVHRPSRDGSGSAFRTYHQSSQDQRRRWWTRFSQSLRSMTSRLSIVYCYFWARPAHNLAAPWQSPRLTSTYVSVAFSVPLPSRHHTDSGICRFVLIFFLHAIVRCVCARAGCSPKIVVWMPTTVHVTHFWHVSGCLTNEFLAERSKSRKESG
jgi:hypothetical protein